MIQSWLDPLLSVLVCWVGLHFYCEAKKRRAARLGQGGRDFAAAVVMWLGAMLAASALTVLATSLVLAWIVR